MKYCALSWQLTVLVGLVAGLPCCGGCGPDTAATGSISGTVTHEGQPLTNGLVMFVNEDAGVGASAELDSSGTYSIRSIQTGNYKVYLAPPQAPSAEEMEKGAKVEIPTLDVPDKYLGPRTSGLSATVEEGEKTADFKL